MARFRGRSGGGILRTVERLGVTRGVFGASKGWFYVGTGLWTLRKVRSLGERKPELLMSERLRPGDRIVIANGVATIESAEQRSLASAPAPRSRRARRKQKRAARKDIITQADLTRRGRRRAARREA